jgi:hypothetical protein
MDEIAISGNTEAANTLLPDAQRKGLLDSA